MQNQFSLKTIQEYLPLGYLYLLVFGIVTDVIYYGALGVNIINYTSVTDILLSPIEKLVDGLWMPVIFLMTLFWLYFFGLPKIHQRFRNNSFYQKRIDLAKYDEKYKDSKLNWGLVLFLALMIFSFSLGNVMQDAFSLPCLLYTSPSPRDS